MLHYANIYKKINKCSRNGRMQFMDDSFCISSLCFPVKITIHFKIILIKVMHQ